MAVAQPGAAGNLAATFRLMYDQSRTGVLEVQSSNGDVQIHLKEGKLVHAVPPPGSDWLLGHILVESGTLPSKKLFRFLRKHRKTGRSLELLLIESGALTRDILSKYLDLQLRETVLPLFLDPEATAEFRDDPPQVNDFVRPLPIPFVLKEAAKRAKEWPILRRMGLTPESVFDKTEESIAHFLEGDDDASRQGGKLGASERLAYYYVNGKKTVQQVAFASSLGDFETLRAIAMLKRRGFIFLTERSGQGERTEAQTVLPKLVGFTFYLVLAVLVALLVLLHPPGVGDVIALVNDDVPIVSPFVRDANRTRISAAIDVFYAEHGAYPHALSELDDLLPANDLAGLIRDIETPGGENAYVPTRDGYLLRWETP